MTTGKLGAEAVFASEMMAEGASKMGCMLTREELVGGLTAMMNLAEVWRWAEDGPAKPLRTTVGGVQFFAERGTCGIELSGHWRLEYEPGVPPSPHKVVICERDQGGWVLQDTPECGAAKIFFQRGQDDAVYISRKIHFSKDQLWDPSQDLPADTGYDQGGRVMFTRSFRGGRAVDEREGLLGAPLRMGAKPSLDARAGGKMAGQGYQGRD